MVYHKIILRLLSVNISINGKMGDDGTLIVSNHASWIDIFIISSIVKTSFVSKSEVSKWPLVSWLANLQKTIFINRNKPKELVKTASEIQDRISKKQNIVLFPEGTSSDGNKVLPFKSSIFILCELEESKNISIQPMSIAYTKYNGLTMSRIERTLIAWYGDMNLIGHLYKLIRSGTFEVEITFHNRIDISEKKSRKDIAQECETVIRNGFLKSLNRGI
tara:strand:- start:108 stop:764 length:657 start_codon:yes stop_codon:yes gene_type:complete